MKLFFLVIIFSLFASVCGEIKTQAQIRGASSGKIINGKDKQSTPNANVFDISTVDFKNFTFPDFTVGNTLNSFTLKNSKAEAKGGFPKYTLRKTYYFDLTGDANDEAISHVIAEGCQMGCDSSNLFYIHTTENNKPKLLWKIATGGDILGGLKAANFKAKEIIFEVFGDCSINNSVIIPNIDMKKAANLKTTNYTRFVFSRSENGFTQTGKDLLPLPANASIVDYHSQISFGEEF